MAGNRSGKTEGTKQRASKKRAKTQGAMAQLAAAAAQAQVG